MKPYPEYKETGLAWLPKIPKYWGSTKLRNLLSIVSIKNYPDKPLLSVVRKKGVIQRNIDSKEENHNYIPDDLSNYKLVKKGQFAMNKMKAWQGSYGISQFEGIVSPAYFVFDLHGISGHFFNMAIRSKAYIPYFGQASEGIRVGQWDLSLPKMREIPFFVPPQNEQEQIVRYLDAMTAKINKLIRAKKKQIALLQEQKQAIINQAVTKGLDPHAEMKDSGIDWLGKIPKHWRLKRLGHFSSFQNGISAPGKYFGHGFPFMGYGEVYNYYELPQTLTELAQSTSEEQRRYSILAGDVFFTRTSETIEEIAFSSVCLKTIPQATFSGFLIRVRPQPENIFPRYAKYYFRSQCVRNYFVKEMNLVTRASLSQRLLRNLPVLLPNLSEQKEIAAYLEKKCSELAFIIAQCEKEITLATEYKNSLILSAVTGKIDLRNTKVEFVASDDQPIKDDSDLEADEESEPISTEGNEG